MLTRIEMQYMNAVIGIHDEIRKANKRGVDWEQRRYEIAKEMMPYAAETYRSVLKAGHGLGYNAEGKTVPELGASSAVAYADALIAELRKEKKAELSQPVTKTGDKDDFIPVGETFEFEGEYFKCAEFYNGCLGCAFYGKECADTPPCGYLNRQDGKDVIFKKLEENKD